VNITITTVGAVDLVPTQKYLKATVMPHEPMPCLSQGDRSKQEEQQHSFKVVIFIWGVLFRMLFLCGTVTENWLATEGVLHIVTCGRHSALPIPTLWFPSHVGYTGQHKDICKYEVTDVHIKQ
jgi:hypothetical protein